MMPGSNWCRPDYVHNTPPYSGLSTLVDLLAPRRHDQSVKKGRLKKISDGQTLYVAFFVLTYLTLDQEE